MRTDTTQCEALTIALTAETGRPCHPTAVARIVRREEYKRGRDKLVDPRVWNAAQAALASRAAEGGRVIWCCSECGWRIEAAADPSTATTAEASARCSPNPASPHRTRPKGAPPATPGGLRPIPY